MSSTGTTQFIRRRIRHWKTTISGMVCIAAPFALVLWPEYSEKIHGIIAAAAGTGLLAASDAAKETTTTTTTKPK